jgi:hypothetical protein
MKAIIAVCLALILFATSCCDSNRIQRRLSIYGNYTASDSVSPAEVSAVATHKVRASVTGYYTRDTLYIVDFSIEDSLLVLNDFFVALSYDNNERFVFVRVNKTFYVKEEDYSAIVPISSFLTYAYELEDAMKVAISK